MQIVVVGAGVVGAACAVALAKDGHAVTVLERDAPAAGTTGASGGFLCTISKRPGPLLALAQASLRLTSEWIEETREDVGYRVGGALLLARDAGEMGGLLRQAHQLQAAGVGTELLDERALRELEPGLHPSLPGGLFAPGDAQVEPRRLCEGFMGLAGRYGAQIRTGASITGVECEGNRVAAVSTRDHRYPCDAVVLATGWQAPELAAAAGVRISIRPRRGCLLYTAPRAPLVRTALLGADYLAAKHQPAETTVSFSLQQHPDGTLVLGGSRDFSEVRHDTGTVREAIRQLAQQYVPALGGVDFQRTSVGFRPWTPDGLPLIGRTYVPNLYLATGHEGDGVSLAAITAQIIADQISGRVSELPIDAVSPLRLPLCE